MPVRVLIDSRSNSSTNVYWSPLVEAKAYNLYVSTLKDGPYNLVVSNIQNHPDPITPNPRVVRNSFTKPGKITFTLSNEQASVTASQEYFIKVTVIDQNNNEDPIVVARTRHVKLPGRAGLIPRNIDSEREKGVLGWFEDENDFRRVHASYQEDSPDDRYSLDVKLIESQVGVANPIDENTGDPIPLEVNGQINTVPRDFGRVLTNGIDLSAGELSVEVPTPEAGLDFEIHNAAVKLNSGSPLTGSVIFAYKSETTEFIINKADFTNLGGPADFFLTLDSRLFLKDVDMFKIYTIGVAGAGVTADVLYTSSKLA